MSAQLSHCCCGADYEVRYTCDTPSTWAPVALTTAQMALWDLAEHELVWCIPEASHPDGAACGKIYESTTTPAYAAVQVYGDRSCFGCEPTFCEIEEICHGDESVTATMTLGGGVVYNSSTGGDQEGYFTFVAQTLTFSLSAAGDWEDTATATASWQFSPENPACSRNPPAQSLSWTFKLKKECFTSLPDWRYNLTHPGVPSPEEICSSCNCSAEDEWGLGQSGGDYSSTDACSTLAATFTGTLEPFLGLPGTTSGSISFSITTTID